MVASMLTGLSGRRYQAALEPVGETIEATASGTSQCVGVRLRYCWSPDRRSAAAVGAALVDVLAQRAAGVEVPWLTAPPARSPANITVVPQDTDMLMALGVTAGGRAMGYG
jgi:hypothetical protein